MKGRGSRFSHREGFTLIEVLVSVAVLALLSVLLLRLVTDTQSASRPALRQMGATAQAQVALDRLALDWAALVARPDVPCQLADAGTNAIALDFFTRVPTSGSGRKISRVSYQMATGLSPGLKRASKEADWGAAFMGESAGGVAMTFSDLPVGLQLAASDYDLLAPGTLRMAVRFLRRDTGGVTQNPPTKNGTVDFDQLAGVLVTLVTLDDQTVKPLTAAERQSLSAAFPDVPDGTLPLSSWEAISSNPGNFPNDIPQSTTSSLRVFQRFFPLPQPQ